MIKRIELRNFRSFGSIVIDFTGKKGAMLDHAFIYGENGSGKTNIIESVAFLCASVRTFENAGRPAIDPEYVDADGMLDIMRGMMEARDTPLSMIRRIDTAALRETMIGADDGMGVTYVLDIDGRDAEYMMEFGPDGRIVHEKLSYTLTDRIGRYFEVTARYSEDGEIRVTGADAKVGRDLIRDPAYRREILRMIAMHWGRHTLLSILAAEYSSKNAEYMESAVRPEMARIIGSIRGMAVYSPDPAVRIPPEGGFDFAQGSIPAEEEPSLDLYAGAARRYTIRLYSNVMGVFYDREVRGGVCRYRLMIQKKMHGEVRDIPIDCESSGIRKMIAMLPYFLACAEGRAVLFDEIDCEVHEKMIGDFIAGFLRGTHGQIVATTHYASLLKGIPPSNAFVIRMDMQGYKDVSCFSSIARTGKNHNNADRYLNGVFDGIPFQRTVDVPQIAEAFREGMV
ncbi:MAG: AAA family ATPase [Thermoplasmata archaeon]|nr:AAA family ATPase [Thermoplasmata archaeon]